MHTGCPGVDNEVWLFKNWGRHAGSSYEDPNIFGFILVPPVHGNSRLTARMRWVAEPGHAADTHELQSILW